MNLSKSNSEIVTSLKNIFLRYNAIHSNQLPFAIVEIGATKSRLKVVWKDIKSNLQRSPEDKQRGYTNLKLRVSH